MSSRNRAARARRQGGLSLIELLISMTIGLLIIGALGAAYFGARGASRTNENLARMQESGRFALDLLAQDLRLTGFYGCRSRNIEATRIVMVARPVVPSNTAGLSFQGAVDALIGYENGSGWVGGGAGPSATRPRLRGDVITIRRAAAGVELAANADIPNGTVTLRNNAPNFQRGDYVSLSTCERLAIFRVTNDPPQGAGATNVVLEHGTTIVGPGFTTSDGNGSNGVQTSNLLLGGGAFDLAARPAAYKFNELSYYIANNPAGRPALFRTSPTGATEEIADNVEDMDLLYGLDDNGDTFADRYVDATTVGAAVEWGRVVAVRVSLLVAGPEVGAASAPAQYALRDTDANGTIDTETSTDTRLRQVFTATLSLRNRSQ